MKVWKEQRKFVVQAMKGIGIRNSKLEEDIQDEIGHFLENASNYNGVPVPVQKLIASSMSNIICFFLFGARFEFDDPLRKKLNENLANVGEMLRQTHYYIAFPWIRHIPFVRKLLDYESGVNSYKTTADIIKKKIDEHKKSRDTNRDQDFIDSYLAEIALRENDPTTSFSEGTLIGNATDLFLAGSGTVLTTLSWCIYTMASYLEVQRKVQKEIQDVLGHGRPEYLDHKMMPFTHAVILETMRWKTIVPVTVPRCTTDDTNIGGYDIPANTIVVENFWAIHHDPQYWKDPDVFIPERFLSPDGISVSKPSSFMPFSIGKRSCPGEAMASLEVFLYFVSILQKFDIKFPEGVQPTFEGVLSSTYQCKPYEVHMVPKKFVQNITIKGTIC